MSRKAYMAATILVTMAGAGFAIYYLGMMGPASLGTKAVIYLIMLAPYGLFAAITVLFIPKASRPWLLFLGVALPTGLGVYPAVNAIFLGPDAQGGVLLFSTSINQIVLWGVLFTVHGLLPNARPAGDH